MSYGSSPLTTLASTLTDGLSAVLGRFVPVLRRSNGSYVDWQASNNGIPLVQVADPLSAFGELKTVNPWPVVQASFEYNVNPALVTASVTGSGVTASQANAMATISTSATINSSSVLTSNRFVTYRMGQGVCVRLTGLFSAGAANGSHEFGIIDDNNGYAFGTNPLNGVFGILHRQNGSDTWYAKSSWNIDTMGGSGPSGMSLDPTKENVYEISMQHLGTGGILFSVEESSTRRLVPVHLIPRANLFTTPTLFRSSLPIRAKVVNTTNNTALTMSIICMSAFVEGQVNWLGTRRARYGSKASIGTLGTDPTPIITLRNPTTGGGGYTTHRVPLIVKGFNAASTTAQAGEIQFIRNATLTGDSFADVDNTMTPAQIDTAASSMSGGRLLESMTVGASVGSPARREFGDHEIILAPGEQVTIAAFSYAATLTGRGAINWIDGI